MHYSKLFMIMVLITNASLFCMDGTKDLSFNPRYGRKPTDENVIEWLWPRQFDGHALPIRSRLTVDSDEENNHDQRRTLATPEPVTDENYADFCRKFNERVSNQLLALTEKAARVLDDCDSREAVKGSDAGDSPLGSPKSTCESADGLCIDDELFSTDSEQEI